MCGIIAFCFFIRVEGSGFRRDRILGEEVIQVFRL